MKRKVLAFFLAVLLILSMISPGVVAANFTDMPSDWSTTALESAVANGLLTGSDGKLYPGNNLTRAQMATIINRAFGAAQKASLAGYTDVAAGAWYYDEMAKAVYMKTFMGSDGKLTPDSNITREQAFVVIARAFKLTGGNPAALDKFSDKAQISGWANDAIASLVEAGYVAGSGGLLSPDKSITRAEFAQIMYNMLKSYIRSPGTYTQVTPGNVMVSVSGVTLKNLTVSGDLIIGDGVGDGEVILDNVKITGRTVVRGGGVNSIKIIGGSELGTVIITKVDGNVRVLAEDGSIVEVMVIDDGKDDVILEGSFENVEVNVSETPVVMQNADVANVNITAPNANLTVGTGSTVGTVSIPQAAQGSTVTVTGRVTNVTSQGTGTTITGTGTVTNANIQGDNNKIDTVGTKVEVAAGVSGTTSGGQTVGGGTNGTTQQGGGVSGGGGAVGGGGGSFGGGGGSDSSPISVTGIGATGASTITFVCSVADATIQFNGITLSSSTIVGTNTVTVPLMVPGASNTLTVSKPAYETFTSNTVVWTEPYGNMAGLSTWATDRTEPSYWDIEDGWITLTTSDQQAADSWYDWQGRGTFTDSDMTDQWKVETQIELTEELLSGTSARTSFWVQVDGVNSVPSTQNNVLDWAILGFRNDPATSTKTWESWDSTGSGAWVPIDTVDVEAGTYTLTMIYDRGTITQYIGGTKVRTYTIETDEGFGNVSAPSYLIVQARTYGAEYTANWAVPKVKYVSGSPIDAKYISDITGLSAAISAQEDGQIWVLRGGTYDLPRRPENVDGQPGWYFPITANNLTIVGLDHPVLSSSEYAENLALASQNLITVWGEDVILDGLTIQPKVQVNKSVEVIAKDITVKNCIFTPNTLVTDEHANATGGGSLYFTGEKENILVEENSFYNTSVAFDHAFPAGTPSILIQNNTWESIGVYAVGNTSWGVNPYTGAFADVQIEGNDFNNVTDATKIITARMNQTFILSATNKINGTAIDKNNFEKYINFNNLLYWILCKDNQVIVDGITYESPYQNVDSFVSDLSALPAAIAAANEGDTILLTAGTYTPTATINVSKAVTILGDADFSTIIAATGGTTIFNLSAAATIDGIFIDKTDKTNQHFITITAAGATVQNCKFIGQFVLGDGEVVRAIVPNAGINGYTISGNHFESIRQPAYLEGAGTVTDNFVKNTKGWVVCVNHVVTFIDNSFEGNAVDIAIIANNQVSSDNYKNIAAISAANNGAYVENQLLGATAEDGYLVVEAGTNVNKNSLANAIRAASTDNVILVLAGTYDLPDTVFSKSLTLIGVGDDTILNSQVTQNAVIAPDTEVSFTDLKISGPIHINNPNAFDYGLKFDNITFESSSVQASYILGIWGSKKLEVNDSRFAGPNANSQSAINVYKGYATVDNQAIITGNTFDYSSVSATNVRGVQAEDIDTVIITENTFTGNSGAVDNVVKAFQIAKGVASADISDNTISYAKVGVMLHSTLIADAVYNDIEAENTFIGCTTDMQDDRTPIE